MVIRDTLEGHEVLYVFIRKVFNGLIFGGLLILWHNAIINPRLKKLCKLIHLLLWFYALSNSCINDVRKLRQVGFFRMRTLHIVYIIRFVLILFWSISER